MRREDFADLAAPVIDLRAAGNSAPGLIRSLRALDLSFVRSTAALLTVPSLHANTVRLEAALHLGTAHCHGRTPVTRRLLRRVLNREVLGTGLEVLEDPIEDVFISNVVSPMGNHRIFEGIWESSGYWLQDVLRVIFQSAGASTPPETCRSILALLAIGEAVAGRLSLSRFERGGGIPKGTLKIPSDGELTRRIAALSFSRKDIAALGINWADLTPFIADRSSENVNQMVHGASYLERHPLIREGNSLFLVLPTAVSPAIRRLAIEVACDSAALPRMETALRANQATRAIGDGLQRLGAQPHPFEDSPTAPDWIDEAYCEFDTDKLAHVVVAHGSLSEIATSGFSLVRREEEAREEVLTLHLRSRANDLAASPGTTGGLTVVVMGGLGQGFSFASPANLPRRWNLFVLSLPDWLTIASGEARSLLLLWKMKEHFAHAEGLGVRFLTHGDLNAFAYWEANAYRLVPREFEPRPGSGISLANDFVRSLRDKVRAGEDGHAAERGHPERWIEVVHFQPESLFEEARSLPVFASPAAAARGNLLGLIETPSTNWWLTLTGVIPPTGKSWAFKVWESVLSWLGKLAPDLTALASAPPRYIEVRLRLEAYPNLSHADSEVVSDVHPTVQITQVGVEVKIPRGFVHSLQSPTNVAEKTLITSLANGFLQFTQTPTKAGQIEAVVNEAMGDEARFLHVLLAQKPYEALSGVELRRMRLVQEADRQFAQFGVSRCSGSNPAPGELTGNKCQKLLHSVVQGIWERTRSRLGQINRRSLIRRCLENIEAIARDEARWNRTAQALQALYSGIGEVVIQRDSDRSKASLCCRVLVEMAVCTSPAEGGRPMSDEDFDWMQAQVSLLIEIATFSDAMYQKFSDPRVVITPSRDIGVFPDFQESVVRPYFARFSFERFEHSAKSYSNLFQARPQGEAIDLAKLIGPEFSAAFEKEFDVGINDFVDAIAALENDSVAKEEVVRIMDGAEISSLLQAAGLSPQGASRLLTRLTLPSRPQWDETRPTGGFSERDWRPWRFQRRLSLVSRPIVPVGNGLVAFGLSTLHEAAGYLVDRSYAGELSEAFFFSSAMKSWIGTANDRRGREFEDRVAQALERRGWQTRIRVEISSLGGPPELGDIDVLAWCQMQRQVLAIECKRLRTARTVAEIGEQLNRFRGDESDELGKHIRRLAWLNENREAVATELSTSGPEKIRGLLVTNTIVPLHFARGLPVQPEDIVVIDALPDPVQRMRITR